MLIEYKIKFEKDGLTITQRVEPGALSPEAKPEAPKKQRSLADPVDPSVPENAAEIQPATFTMPTGCCCGTGSIVNIFSLAQGPGGKG
jgi:hypothetical protein